MNVKCDIHPASKPGNRVSQEGVRSVNESIECIYHIRYGYQVDTFYSQSLRTSSHRDGTHLHVVFETTVVHWSSSYTNGTKGVFFETDVEIDKDVATDLLLKPKTIIPKKKVGSCIMVEGETDDSDER
jgi:hypothetical protein